MFSCVNSWSLCSVVWSLGPYVQLCEVLVPMFSCVKSWSLCSVVWSQRILSLFDVLLVCFLLVVTEMLAFFYAFFTLRACPLFVPQWGAADAEIKVPSGENTELKRSPFKVWSRSVYSHTCYAYCQEFLPRLFLPFQSIHLHFFQNLSQFFTVLAVANTGSCVGPQNKIGHPVWCRFPCWVPAEYK